MAFNFKEFLNEKIDIRSSQVSKVSEVISASLHLISQFHIWHWLADSRSCHDALGHFYETLPGLLDELAEVYISNSGVLSSSSQYKDLDFLYSKEKAKMSLEEYRNLITSSFIDDKSSDSINLHLQDIQNLTDKTIYLLDLM